MAGKINEIEVPIIVIDNAPNITLSVSAINAGVGDVFFFFLFFWWVSVRSVEF